MNIVVLIKQVPDMDRVKFDSEKGVVDRKSAGGEINPFDLNALEAGVQLKEKIGGNVVAISMGPPSAEDSLREAIARGADEGVLLSDKKFGGADTRATAATLAGAIKRIGKFDLIIAGEKTVDGDTGQVGAEAAEYLDIPYVSYVTEVLEADDENIQIVSEIWEGSYLKKMKLPGLMTVTKDINTPRLPSFKNKMKARKAEIKTMGFEDVSSYLSEEEIGFKGSPTKVKRIEVPPVLKREGKVWRDEINEALDAVMKGLEEKKVLEG